MNAVLSCLALAAVTAVLAGCGSPPPSTKSVARAPSSEARQLDADQALHALLLADRFEDVWISVDGHLSPGVRSFRVLFAAPDATHRFRELLSHGTLAGQLYAAIGLRHHDPDAYAAAVERLRLRADERVPTRFGCLGGSQRVGELLESRGPEAIRLAHGQTFDEWMMIHRSGQEDIVGGAFTSTFGEVPSRI